MNGYVLHVLDYDAAGDLGPISAPGELLGIRADGKVFYTRGYDYSGRGEALVGTTVIHASAFDGAKLHLIDTLASNGGDALPVGANLFVFDWKQVVNTKGGSANFASLWWLGDNGDFQLLDEEKFGGYGPRAFGNVLFAQSYSGYGSGIAALDFSNPGDLKSVGTYRLPGWLSGDLGNADGNPSAGIWLPLGNYGVIKIELPK